jgi:hypothetical protein
MAETSSTRAATSEYRRWLIPKGNVFRPSGAGIAKLVDKLRKEKWIVDPKSATFQKLAFESAPLAAKSGGFSKRAIDVSEPRNASAGWAATPYPLSGEWLDHPDRADLVLRFPVHPIPKQGWQWGPDSLHHPLTGMEDVAAPLSYVLELHRGDDYVYPLSDCIDPIDTECACGEDLAFEWDDSEIQSPFGGASGIFTECSECSRTFDPAHAFADVTCPFTKKKTSVRGGAAYRFALVVDCGASFPARGPMPAFHPELKALCEAEFGRDFYEVGAID